jgi:hypothetical protein
VHLESISVHLKTAAASLKVTGSMEKSSDMMKTMSKLVNAAETSAVSRELAQELSRFGIMEEMMGDALDSAMDPDGDLEELADGEVVLKQCKIVTFLIILQVEALVQEIISGVKLGGKAGSKAVPQAATAEEVAAADLERQAAELDRRMKELGK